MSIRLGNYEMVMALSEDSVNDLLSGLQTDGFIRNVWSIRIKYDEDHDYILDSTVIDENYDSENENPSFAAVDARFTAAFEAAKNKDSFMSGFIATVKAPFISIKADKPFEVGFNIPFESGRMDRISPHTDALRPPLQLGGLVYEFTVALSKIECPYSTADENVKKYIAEAMSDAQSLDPSQKLSPGDFTIEKLFLDFETADFIADSFGTIYPPSWNEKDRKAWVDLQVLLQEYFKSPTFKEGNNPYVLGYGVTIPKLEKRADAVFQPRSLNFSTSFVPAAGQTARGDGKKCSLNYMMMMTKAPDKGSGTGTMTSLLDQHDLLGIDYNLFFDRYLKQVFDAIAAQLNATVSALNKQGAKPSKSVNGLYVSGSEASIVATGAFGVSVSTDKMHVTLGSANVTAVSGWGAKITNERGSTTDTRESYTKAIYAAPKADVQFRDDGHMRIRLAFMENASYHATAVFMDRKATSKQDKAGLNIDLYPGGGGNMIAAISPYDDGPPAPSPDDQKGRETIDMVNGYVSGGFYSELYLPSFQQQLASRLTEGLKSLPQIILPISNVYEYKAVGFTAADNTLGVITFQSTYAPVYGSAPVER